MSQEEAAIEEAEVTEYSITSIELLRAMLEATDILEKVARGEMTIAEAMAQLEMKVASVIRSLEESAKKKKTTSKRKSSRKRKKEEG